MSIVAIYPLLLPFFFFFECKFFLLSSFPLVSSTSKPSLCCSSVRCRLFVLHITAVSHNAGAGGDSTDSADVGPDVRLRDTLVQLRDALKL